METSQPLPWIFQLCKRGESEQLGQFGPVDSVFNDTKLDVSGVLSPEGSIFIIRDLLDHVQSLRDKFLLNDLQELCCWSVSLETLRVRSSESTTPLTNLR